MKVGKKYFRHQQYRGGGRPLEIVQFNLGSDHIPNESAVSGGRFLAITPDYLDNMIYRTGRRVAVIGKVKEMRILPLDQTEYSYPVIAILEIRVWRNVEDYQVDRYYNDPFFYSSPGTGLHIGGTAIDTPDTGTGDGDLARRGLRISIYLTSLILPLFTYTARA